ncbi:MAG: hypothetical protein WA940_05970, partial [Sphingopyxis sp.]
MLSFVPLVLFLLVTLATLIRGRSVRARTGVSAFAFLEARGLQRVAGFVFGLAITALVAASLLLALGRLAAPPAALAAGSALMGLGALDQRGFRCSHRRGGQHGLPGGQRGCGAR